MKIAKQQKHKEATAGTKRIVILIGILFILLCPSAYSRQNGKILVTGIITDYEGLPLVSANVLEKGTSNGTITDFEGRYSITVSPQSALVVTYLGFETKEVSVKGKQQINVILIEEVRALDEVLITALGIKKQAKMVGYAVSEVSGTDLTKGGDGNAVSSLSGRVAGMDVSTGSGGPAGSTRVVIRGLSELSGNNTPLYVIDGVPIDDTMLGSANQDGGYDLGDAISSLNPDDIHTVSVLKGASASALYGSRASNGVVLITTKSGKNQKGLGIDFTTNVNAVKMLTYFDDYQREYGQGANSMPPYLPSLANTSTQNAWGARLDPNMNMYIYDGTLRPYANQNNNILSFFRTGVTVTNTLSLSNSTDKYDYRFSVSDLRNSDIVPSAGMARTTFMLKGGAKLGRKVEVEARANYSTEAVRNRPALSDSPNNIGNALIGIAPSFDQRWLKDNYKDSEGRYTSWNANRWRLNPYWVINEMENKSNKDRLMGHMQVNYHVFPWLSAQARVGLDYSDFHFMDYAPLYTDGIDNGRMAETMTEIHEVNYEGMLRFKHRFKDVIELSGFVGGNVRTYKYESYYLKGEGQIMPDVKDIMNYSVIYPPQHTLIRKQVNSLFGALNVGYKDFVYLDFTIRNDISSTLNENNRSYVYPSVSGSFLLSEVADLRPYKISFAKLRASWAKVGGDTSPYKLYQAYSLLPYTINGKAAGQIANKKIMPNKDLKPTSTYSYEFGVDVRFLNNRLGLDVGYYHQWTNDQIMNLPITLSAGYNSAMINAGVIVNKGVEITLNAVPVRTKEFEWNMNINGARNVNRIKELHPEIDIYEISAARWGGASVVAKVGERYGSIMGRKFKRNEAGQVIYDGNGMPTFEDNVSVMGNGNYDFTLGFGNNFKYKDFTLGVLIDMKLGADLYSMSARMAAYNGTSKRTLEGRYEWSLSEQQRLAANKNLNEWTPTGGLIGKGVVNGGTDANGNIIWVKNATPVDPQKYWQRITDNTPEPFIYDASYIKLRELTLSYSVPARVLANTVLKGVTFTAYGRNLLILHCDIPNIDPESNYNSGNGQGFEYGSLPSRRTFGGSVNVKF